MGYKFDVVISYKSEIKDKAMKIADYLTADGWKVFLDQSEQQELLSEKLHQKLYDIYKNKSLMKVLLISDSYLNGEWTALEKRVSLESTKSDRRRLLIVNYTKLVILPGELQSLQYLNGREVYEDEIACTVTERLKKYLKDNKNEDIEKIKPKRKNAEIINNHGIIAGDHANFGDIHF